MNQNIIDQIRNIHNNLKIEVRKSSLEDPLCVTFLYDHNDKSYKILSDIEIKKDFINKLMNYIPDSNPFDSGFLFRDEIKTILKDTGITLIFMSHFDDIMGNWYTIISSHSDIENSKQNIISVLKSIKKEI